MKFFNHYLLSYSIAMGTFVSGSSMATENAELEDFLALLEEQTKLATQSKMNADYVPGTVSILHASNLLAYGAQTVATGLEHAAGFYMTVDNTGAVTAIIRGVGASLTASNIKLMLNGVAMNTPYDGSAEWLLKLPLEQVDRIEVIRGPGSSLYGEFAFSGVVNVITTKQNAVMAKFSSNQAKQADVALNKTFSSGFNLTLNMSLRDQDNSGLQSNPDDFASFGLGYSPGAVYDHENAQVIIANAEYDGYQLQYNYANTERGGWYGRTANLPKDLEPKKDIVSGIALSKQWELSTNLTISANFAHRTTNSTQATFLPIPLGVNPPGPIEEITTELYRRLGYKDESTGANLNVNWQASDQHRLFIELGHTSNKVDSLFIARYELGNPANIEKDTLLPKRQISSLTVQDMWKVSDNLELTLGARYDRYDDWGSHTSPRIAAVWRKDENHIFKVQYADAFRPPTLANLNPDSVTESLQLTEEKLKTLEFSYIYKQPDATLRTTLFNTEIDDLIEFFIHPGQPPTFRNIGSVDVHGVELEWQQKLGRKWQWFSNISYTDTTDKFDDDKLLTGAVNWLANLGITWRPNANIRHALKLRYVGTQEGWEIPAIRGHNETFGAYHLLDYSIELNNAFNITNLTMNATVNNLTDNEYDILPYPANYPKGLHMGKRNVWLKLSYHF